MKGKGCRLQSRKAEGGLGAAVSYSEWRVLSLELKAMKETGSEWKDCGEPRKVLDCGMLCSAKEEGCRWRP